MIAAPTSAGLVRAFGTNAIVALGLGLRRGGVAVVLPGDDDGGYWLVGTVVVVVGFGMGFAMAPATDSIMGAVRQRPASARR